MDLARDGREYAHAGFQNLPASPPAPEVNIGGAWHPLPWWDDEADPEWQRQRDLHGITQAAIDDGSARLARVLLAGPDATDNPVGTVVVTASTRARARLGDATETVVRALDSVVLLAEL